MKTIDLSSATVRELNQALHEQARALTEREWVVSNPGGKHNLAVGLNEALSVEIDGHGGLRLTDAARPVLRGEQRLFLREESTARERRRRKGSAAPLLASAEQALFEALRAERRRLADAHGVPAYVIFHDATLAQMAAERPRTLAELAQINGVGAAKLERYGEAFLAVIGGMTP